MKHISHYEVSRFAALDLWPVSADQASLTVDPLDGERGVSPPSICTDGGASDFYDQLASRVLMAQQTHRRRAAIRWLLVALLFTADVAGLLALPMSEGTAQVSPR